MSWPDAQIERVVYCTARIDGATNPSGHADQDVYLKALLTTGSVDHIEYGTYVSRVKTAPLAVKDPHGRPQLVGPAWPVMIQDGRGGPVNGAVFMVSYANREEKGVGRQRRRSPAAGRSRRRGGRSTGHLKRQ